MNTAIKTESHTTAEERARDLLLNVFGGRIVLENGSIDADLSRGLAEALRGIASEERAAA